MNTHSTIYAYDKATDKMTDIHLGFDYLNGSHGLDWHGIKIERLKYSTSEPRRYSGTEVYYKEYLFAVTLNDMVFNINDETIDTDKGDIFMTPMNTPFTLENPNSFSTIMMTLSHEFITDHFYDKQLDQIKFISNYRLADNNLYYLIRLILEQAVAGTTNDDLYLNQLFTTFVTYYVMNLSNYNQAQDEHVLNSSCIARIDQYIDENFSNDVTYKDISELSGMSSYSFLTEFKALTSHTPHQYILKRKLKKAKDLLLNSSMSVTEISYELGFTDSSHFSKFFKKHTSIAPSHYRQQMSDRI